jgi:hypothetical protein
MYGVDLAAANNILQLRVEGKPLALLSDSTVKIGKGVQSVGKLATFVVINKALVLQYAPNDAETPEFAPLHHSSLLQSTQFCSVQRILV